MYDWALSGSAARALRVGTVGIEPEAKRHSDRLRESAQERDRTVDAAAHRHGGPTRRGFRVEDGTDRVRERVDRERLAADRRRLQQCQADERPLEPGRVRLDDSVAVDDEPDGGPVAAAGGVSEDLEHG